MGRHHFSAWSSQAELFLNDRRGLDRCQRRIVNFQVIALVEDTDSVGL
jgi:hypothetical protein